MLWRSEIKLRLHCAMYKAGNPCTTCQWFSNGSACWTSSTKINDYNWTYMGWTSKHSNYWFGLTDCGSHFLSKWCLQGRVFKIICIGKRDSLLYWVLIHTYNLQFHGGADCSLLYQGLYQTPTCHQKHTRRQGRFGKIWTRKVKTIWWDWDGGTCSSFCPSPQHASISFMSMQDSTFR